MTPAERTLSRFAETAAIVAWAIALIALVAMMAAEMYRMSVN